MANFHKIIEQYRDIARSKTEIGNRFEHLIKRYLLSYQFYENDKVEQIWLWNEWRYKSQLGGHDTGIDLVALTTKGDYWAIQCKCQAADSFIDKTAVDSFLATSGKIWIDDQQIKRSFQLCLFVSTTNNWSKNAESAFKNQRTEFFKINLSDLEKSPVNWALLSKGVIGSKVLTKPHTLRPHQQDALDAVHEYFKTYDRGKLIMACGTGKTFTALRIAEDQTGPNGFVLFLVPSISLLRQVFEEWRDHKKTPINFVCICSDATVAQTKNHDEVLIYDISELPWPATTNVQQISKNLITCLSQPGMTVVFSTYQSIDVIADVQKNYQIKCFDLIICDEAHRTTGVTLPDRINDESNFKKVHHQQYINGKKRLYMTATPLIYDINLKKKLDLKNYTYISMDDEANYGTEIYRLSFGEAVAKKLLTNYKLIILTIDPKKDVDPVVLQSLLKTQTSSNEITNYAKNKIKLGGCINALKKSFVDNDEAKFEMGTDDEPMQRAVAFCSRIQDSSDIADLFNEINQETTDRKSYVVSALHIDGHMSAIDRNKSLKWLEEDIEPLEARVLTNVRCLNEGIDVPALDAVLFLSARSSKIDIVQSIGRVMRTSPGKKLGYIIIPVIVVGEKLGDEIFIKNHPEYQVVWSVINALVAHDESFKDEISKLTYTSGKYNKHDRLVIGQLHHDHIKLNEFDDQGQINVQIQQFRQLIEAQTITHQQLFWIRWVAEINTVYESQKQQISNAINLDDNFRRTFDQFHELFKLSHQAKSIAEFIEMIAQHVVMKPVFKALFENQFADTNPVNVCLDAILNQLHTTNLQDQKKLDEFYKSVKSKTASIESAANKQALIMEIYNKFFKIAFPKEVAKLGIVYTPTPIVDFIVKSVADLLPIHFNTTINDHSVYVMDPFAGTGSFIVRLLENNLIKPEHLLHKYQHNIYASEITLLAYYIALINIINSFYYLKVPDAIGTYTNFWGMRFLDTFQTTEKNYHNWNYFHKKFYENKLDVADNPTKPPFKYNTYTVLKNPPITVIIGNPPYSVGQSSFNDQNQNTTYDVLDKQITNTYVVQSSSRSSGSLYDSYYKAFRWSTDRFHPEGGGIIGFVTNGGWLTSVSGAGFRKSIAKEYNTIYVINLRGNALTSGELRRKEGDGVFDSGSRVSVAIVFLIKTPTLTNQPATIYYYAVDDYLKRQAKFDLLNTFQTVTNPVIPWTIINPDMHGDWIDQVIEWPLNSILFRDSTLLNVFTINSRHFMTGRDDWVINFDKSNLQNNVQTTINFYESERYRLKDEIKAKTKLLSFTIDLKQISWTDPLSHKLQFNRPIIYDDAHLFKCHYYPFILSHIYFDSSLIDSRGKQHQLFLKNSLINRAIMVSTPGLKIPWSVFITNQLFGLGLCFPEHTYQTNQDGTITTLNAINDHVLKEAQSLYNDSAITHTAIFDYLYGLLHHPTYQLQYQNNLQKGYPNLIWTADKTTWWTISNIGRQLANVHLNFETITPTTIVNVINNGEGEDLFKITKMKYDKEKNSLIFNTYITITNLPTTIHDYQVFGRSPLKWIIDYYQVSIDKETGIKNDPNQLDSVKQNPRYLLDLVLRIINLTTHTLTLIDELTKQEF